MATLLHRLGKTAYRRWPYKDLFFSDNKRTVFLYYKDSYYLLNEENETIKPLAPINDPSLLKKLKDYRGSR